MESFETDLSNTRNTKQVLIEVSNDFAENTSLNGIKYIAHKDATFVERLFWLFTFTLSFVFCVIMLCKTYHKWQESGIIVALKEHPISVNELPFPAVTICPQARIRNGYLDDVINDSEFGGNEAYSIMIFCDFRVNETNYTETVETTSTNANVNMDVFYELAPRHNDVFSECSWRGKCMKCDDVFRPVLTEEGVCFTFNTLAANEIFRNDSVYQMGYYLNTSTSQKNWSIKDNYHGDHQNTYPRRGRGNGAMEDLNIKLKEIKDRVFECDGHSRTGYKVYLHHPAEMPQSLLHYYPAQPGKTTSFSLKLDIMETSTEIKDKKPEERQCFYPSERELKFYKSYSERNCQLECLTNYTLKKCGCVHFYMPRDNQTTICDDNKMKCLDIALDNYAVQEGLSMMVEKCQCLPNCNNVNYEAEITTTETTKVYNTESDDKNEDFDESDDSDDVIVKYTKQNCESNLIAEQYDVEIKMYYKESRFIAMERKELFDLSEFLANTGGTLGLFVGFTVSTLAEFIYFFIIKFIYAIRRIARKARSTSY